MACRSLGTARFVGIRAYLYVLVALVGVAGAIAAQRPIAVAVAAPALVALLVGAGRATWPEVHVGAAIEPARLTEREPFELTIYVRSDVPISLVRIEIEPHDRLEALGPRRAIRAIDDTLCSATFQLRPVAVGPLDLGTVSVVAHDRGGLLGMRRRIQPVAETVVDVERHSIRTLLGPRHFRGAVGSHLSPARGEGTEIADVRPYRPGDRLRQLNWRITARHGEPWITERHTDRATDVVLLVDVDEEIGPVDRPSVHRTLTGARAIAAVHLRAQDRVGVMMLGHRVTWLAPALGRRQLHRVGETLLTNKGDESRSMRVQRRAGERSKIKLFKIPDGSIVVALTPLADWSIVDALVDLRSHRHLVYAIEVGAEPEAPPTHHGASAARRLFALEQAARRRHLQRRGVICAPWPDETPLEAVVRSMSRARGTVERARA